MASEKHEKSKQHIPKDARVICSILKEIRICDFVQLRKPNLYPVEFHGFENQTQIFKTRL
jgi:hypothetical protein